LRPTSSVGKLQNSIEIALGPARLKGDILSLHVAELTHLLAERTPPSLPARIGRAVVEQADPEDLACLLGRGGERRGEKAAGHRDDECSSLHAGGV